MKGTQPYEIKRDIKDTRNVESLYICEGKTVKVKSVFDMKRTYTEVLRCIILASPQAVLR